MEENTDALAALSVTLRQAIRAALPTAPDQYLTISMPGHIIDTRPGGEFIPPTDPTTASTNNKIRVNEARLVDSMIPLSPIMLGPSGRSVSRSYLSALNQLVPRHAGLDMENLGGGASSSNSPATIASAYEPAMKYLKTEVPAKKEGVKTIVDVYIEKQTACGEAQSKLEEVLMKNAEMAQDKGGMSAEQLAVATSKMRRANNRLQGAWMDWVVNGYKTMIDSQFAIVDTTTAMGRIEMAKLKASLRRATISDLEDSVEWARVTLSPANWAQLCADKSRSWVLEHPPKGQPTQAVTAPAGAQEGTVPKGGQLVGLGPEFDVATRASHAVWSTLGAIKGALSIANDAAKHAVAGAKPYADAAKDKLHMAHDDIKTAFDDAKASADSLANAGGSHDDRAAKATKALESARKALAGLRDAHKAAAKAHAKSLKVVMATVKPGAKNAEDGSQDAGDALNASGVDPNASGGDPNASGDEEDDVDEDEGDKGVADDVDVEDGARPAHETKAVIHSTIGFLNLAIEILEAVVQGPRAASAPPTTQGADPWTTITFKGTKKEESGSSKKSEVHVEGSVGGGLGLFSGSASGDMDKSSQEFKEKMENCEVHGKFSAILVQISRPWLHGELFQDDDITTAPLHKLSPGPASLREYIDGCYANRKLSAKLTPYSVFPWYPTAFLIAADTELEIVMEAKEAESFSKSLTTEVHASASYGPFFSASGSSKTSDSSSGHHAVVTESGVKISYQAPQIIGWVSEMLPELPRPDGVGGLAGKPAKRNYI